VLTQFSRWCKEWEMAENGKESSFFSLHNSVVVAGLHLILIIQKGVGVGVGEPESTITIPKKKCTGARNRTHDPWIPLFCFTDPCAANSSLCTGVGQECVFTEGSADGYICDCRTDYDPQNDGSCTGM
jgi:hypothetical protein